MKLLMKGLISSQPLVFTSSNCFSWCLGGRNTVFCWLTFLLSSNYFTLAPSLGSHPLPLGFPIALGHFSLHSFLTFDSMLSKKPFSMKQAQKLLLITALHPGSTLAFLGLCPPLQNTTWTILHHIGGETQTSVLTDR